MFEASFYVPSLWKDHCLSSQEPQRAKSERPDGSLTRST